MAANPDFLPPPSGECKTENPDGVSQTSGYTSTNSLYDGEGRPKIQSGDWQVRPPGMNPRGRP